MACLPRQAALAPYAPETDGTARLPKVFDLGNGEEEAVMYIGIGGLILLIILLVILF